MLASKPWPLYAPYLQTTGITYHPGHKEITAAHETDWRKVVNWLTGPIPDQKTIFYQKHMAQHLLPEMDLQWVNRLTNCLLIREPREMLTSLLDFFPEPRLEDTGLPQQLRLYEYLIEHMGQAPPILDARDVLHNPRQLLSQLCDKVGVPFLEEMLHWPPGLRDTDGVWSRWWYQKVAQTTSFGEYRPKSVAVPQEFHPLLDRCEEIYHRLYQHRLR